VQFNTFQNYFDFDIFYKLHDITDIYYLKTILTYASLASRHICVICLQQPQKYEYVILCHVANELFLQFSTSGDLVFGLLSSVTNLAAFSWAVATAYRCMSL